MKRWINIINFGMFFLAAILVVSAFAISFTRPKEISAPIQAKLKGKLPKNSFELTKECYSELGKHVFLLNYVAPKMQIPDLGKVLVYYGKNGRPDANTGHPLLYFSLQNRGTIYAVDPRDRVYLQYDKHKGVKGGYEFSKENRQTSLWVSVATIDDNVNVSVAMIDEKGNQVSQPEEYANFTLKEKQMPRRQSQGWELGKWRVDGTLLARQRTRWLGQDKFIENHGGEEFQDKIGKNRIDFGEKDDIYSVYVGLSDSLIWKDNRWQKVEPGPESQGYPLLFVKKVDDRLMGFELWDKEGKRKIKLNLLKSMETWMPNEIEQDFRFIGARTRSQFVFEVDCEKMLISPHDWLLLTDEGWIKLASIEDIDDYVDRKKVGTLFVFNGVVRQDDGQVIKGFLYNPSRTEMQQIELPVQKDGIAYNQLEKAKLKSRFAKRQMRDSSSYAEGASREKNKAYWRNKLKGNISP